MITFVCWKWQSDAYEIKYTAAHVNALATMLAEYYRAPHRLICVTDDPSGISCETYPLWSDHASLLNPAGDHFPSCYRRLKIFDPLTTFDMDIPVGSMLVSIDLDVVIVSDLIPLLSSYQDADFAGWLTTVGGFYHPTGYNGSLFRFKVGRMAPLWTEFDPVISPLEVIGNRFFGSDQGWMSYKLKGRFPGWGRSDGVYSYAANLCSVRGMSGALPSNARIVCFNGRAKPWDEVVRRRWPWIARHWRHPAPAVHKVSSR